MVAPGRTTVVLVLAALSVAVGGCAGEQSLPAGDDGPGPKTSDHAPSPATAPPQPADQCGKPATPARTFWLSGPDGAWLQAATVGSGPDTAVFVHESGTQGLCGFWSYADWLASTEGVRSVLFNQCAYGSSQCAAIDRTREWIAATAVAVAWARDQGARRVTIVGASVGGIVALHAATSITPAVDAVVDLSGELSWSGLDSMAAAQRLDVPVLFAVAPGDRYVTVDDMRSVYQAASADPKQFVVLPDGAGHGWEMLRDARGTGWSPFAVTVASWIHGSH